jgi:hypothetical protein
MDLAAVLDDGTFVFRHAGPEVSDEPASRAGPKRRLDFIRLRALLAAKRGN